MGIPNVQLTTLLFLVYFSQTKPYRGLILILEYTIIMGLIWGFSMWLIPMYIGWFFAWLLYYLFKTDNVAAVALKSMFMASLFGFSYGVFTWIVYSYSSAAIIGYIVSDLPFQSIMALSNAFSVLILFKPILFALKTGKIKI